MNAGVQVKIQSFGFPAVESAIKKIVIKAGHLKVPFDVPGKYLVTRAHERFEHERSAEGEPWASLTESYVVRPKIEGGRGGSKHPILHLHGYLEQSVTYKADDAGLALGTNRKFPGGEKPATAIHQLGGVARRAKIPARPFLGLNAEDHGRIGDFIIDYLAKL